MKKVSKVKKVMRSRRHRKIRSKISGTSDKPRLSVFKSNQHIYASLIDDTKHKTLLAVNDLKLKEKSRPERASRIGQILASDAIKKRIKKVVFDRGGFKYHGLIKILAESARASGLKF